MTGYASVSFAWAVVIMICLAYAAVCDIAVRLIPNSISVAVASLAVPLRLVDHQLIQGLLVALLVFAILTFAWFFRLIGGGDVKLWSACTLLVPPRWLDQGAFAVRVLLVGGIVGLLYLGLRWGIRLKEWRSARKGESPLHRSPNRAWLRRIWRVERWRARHGGSIPYGVAIAASACLTLWPQLPR